MSNYTKNVNFTAKDTLASGNPSKKILGSEFDGEFDEIATSMATKLDDSSGNVSTLATNDYIFTYNTAAANTKKILVSDLRTENFNQPATPTNFSGASTTVTGISPSAKRITINVVGVSASGASDAMYLRSGSGAIESATYSGGFYDGNSGFGISSGSQWEVIPFMPLAVHSFTGTILLTKHQDSTNRWVVQSSFHCTSHLASAYFAIYNGSKSFSGVIDRVQFLVSSTFDAGSFNVLVEI